MWIVVTWASAAPQEVVFEQDAAFGGMVTISLNGGADSIAPFVESLKVITLATSLGDTSSLAWPIIGTDLVRLSIGLENEEDLLADLDNALERIPG